MNKSLFMSNFKFKKNKNEESIYKTTDSLNSPNLDLLDTTLNTTLNSTILDDQLSPVNTPNNLNNGKTSNNNFTVPFNHVLSADQIIIDKELGKGEFGIVRQGVWTNDKNEKIQVAIKCLSKERINNNSAEFLKEAHIMHKIDHPNIVRLYGVVLDDGNSMMLVTELAPFKSLLECLKDQSIKSTFTVSLLCDFAYQICDGMKYLESKRLIHRDLAARNILVFTKNLVKISDFGLSRALGVGKDYYQTNFNENLRLPIGWSAPENINYLKFTSSSDVWSYGVTLYELFSYGNEPWRGYTGKQILEAIDEPNYQRLEQPECCPKDYYLIMIKCWNHDPSKRPKFSEIIKILPDCKPEHVQAVKNSPLTDLNNSNYLQFNQGDIITVLDKNPNFNSINGNEMITTQQHALWKGCLNNGNFGLFNPNLTVSYLGQNLPNCGNLSPTNNSNCTNSNNQNGIKLSVFIKSILDKTTNQSKQQQNNSKKKIKPAMISKPEENSLKHTGHVGADGAFFGDISYLGDKYQLIPKQIVNPYKPINDSLDKISMSDRIPLLNSRENSSIGFNKKDNSLKRNKLTINTNGINNASTDHEYHEIGDEDGLCSPKFKPLDFGPSLMDEVFKELNFGLSTDFEKEFNIKNSNENQNKLNSSDNHQKASSSSSNQTLLPTKKKQALVKPISAAEEESLDSAIAMVKELATKSMFSHFDSKDKNDMSLNLLDNCSLTADSPRFSVTSPTKKKFTFKIKSSKENKTFTDQLNNKQTDNIADSLLSQESKAKEAYESLVESGTLKNKLNGNKNESKDQNKKTSNYPSLTSVTKVASNRARAIFSRQLSRNNLPKPPPIPSCKDKENKTDNKDEKFQLNDDLTLITTNNQINKQYHQNNSNNNLINQQQQLPNLIQPPNPLPLPPKRSDIHTKSLIHLKHHERRHPLILPNSLDGIDIMNFNSLQNKFNEPKPQLMSSFKPNMMPLMSSLHRNISFNEATKQNTFLNSSPASLTTLQTNLIKDHQRCQQIPSDQLNQYPIINECRTPNSNKNFIEIFTHDNRNIKIELSETDEVRLLQKILSTAHQIQLSSEECLKVLEKTNMEVHKAIKVVLLGETLKQQQFIEKTDYELIQILEQFNWSNDQAISHLLVKHCDNQQGATAV